ncbi:6-phosphofructokinase 5 chloroplastic-like, partial [Trifolium medium]|nr:6-phosphofructokinase 5 chloroplastic-like [Trifolium medium]
LLSIPKPSKLSLVVLPHPTQHPHLLYAYFILVLVLTAQHYVPYDIAGLNEICWTLGVHRAGPREKIYYKPEEVKAAIVTCGGLCPGLNDVIRQ